MEPTAPPSALSLLPGGFSKAHGCSKNNADEPTEMLHVLSREKAGRNSANLALEDLDREDVAFLASPDQMKRVHQILRRTLIRDDLRKKGVPSKVPVSQDAK